MYCVLQLLFAQWEPFGWTPFATLLFSVCISVTVACCVLYPSCMDVFAVM